MTGPETVSVIVAVWNSADTITRAIESALVQPEVSEVIVVDDASTDGTLDAVEAVAARSGGRVRVLSQAHNGGPSLARNRAIAESRAPLIAILDADDYLVPGRFARLLATPHWDAIGDNVAFVSEKVADPSFDNPRADAAPEAGPMTVESFVRANISRRGHPRAELGFLKPVIRKSFLDRHGLRYDEKLRLGEDYALYAKIIAGGGRFLTSRACGYVAVERVASLSSRHRAEDIAAMADFDAQLLRSPGLGKADRAAVAAHLRQVQRKYAHRRLLDMKTRRGYLPAILDAATRPSLLPAVVVGIVADKFGSGDLLPVRSEVRYLLP